MAKRKKHLALNTAEKYASLLLYQVTGGNLGTKPEKDISNNTATFGEMRGLLDSLIKIATLERENESGEESPSGFDKIKKDLEKRRKQDDGAEAWGSGNTEGPAVDSGGAGGEPE